MREREIESAGERVMEGGRGIVEQKKIEKKIEKKGVRKEGKKLLQVPF